MISQMNFYFCLYRDTKPGKRHIDDDYDRRIKCDGMNYIE